MYFAGHKLVEESLENYLKYSDFNVGGSLNFIKFMDKYEFRIIWYIKILDLFL